MIHLGPLVIICTSPVDEHHCYEFTLTNTGSGVFLASPMLEQDLNSGIEYLQEQELKQNKCKKNYAGTSIENNSILVPA